MRREARRNAGAALRMAVALFILLIACADVLSAQSSLPALHPAQSNYPGVGKACDIRSVTRDGKQVVLSDGSKWTVQDHQGYITALWKPRQHVVVTKSKSGSFPYTLTDTSRDKYNEVNAKYNGS
jgi:hypothetical protein